jgi:sulfur relay (sulfurtransferase) complex TusBCD TusD component (DsrE family)
MLHNMKTVLIINEPPYGTERVYNALRVAQALLKKQPMQVSIFLIADAVLAAKSQQKTPEGFIILNICTSGSLLELVSFCSAGLVWTRAALAKVNC